MSMNLRHAAVLALVGWYLMSAPMTPDHQVLTDAPLSKWKTGASFDTAKECEAANSRLREDAKKYLDSPDVCDMAEAIGSEQCGRD
jgi:hypothetical protein